MSKKDKSNELEEPLQEAELTQEEPQHEEEVAHSDADQETHDTDPNAELKADLAKEKDKFLRLFAEFENYKKRTTKERMELFRTAGQEVLSSLLPVLDDFERALKEIYKSSDKELYKGVELIDNKLRETLKSKGLEEIKVETGDAFDPEVHEAITQIPAPDDKLKGKVIDVIEKGYQLGERVIRHPKVVVGQ